MKSKAAVRRIVEALKKLYPDALLLAAIPKGL